MPYLGQLFENVKSLPGMAYVSSSKEFKIPIYDLVLVGNQEN